MFVIEDELHAEWQGEFQTRHEAISELRRRALISWDEEPNAAPCTDWITCGRKYELVEFDDSTLPWKELSRTLLLEISANGVQWLSEEQG
jgi:hypothetical protein